MKRAHLLVVILALVSLSPIEYEMALILQVEGQMRDSPSTVGYRYLGEGRFEFTDIHGLTWQRSFGDVRTMGGLKPKKIISIDLRNIDTTGFSACMSELAVVQVGNQSLPPIGGRMDPVSPLMLIGSYYILRPRDPIRIFLKDVTGFTFTHVFSFINGFDPDAVTDVDLNGSQDLIGDSLGCIISFKRNPQSGLPVDRDYFWYGITGSAQVPRIADLDKDRYPEIIQRQFGNGFLGTVIVKYDTLGKVLHKVSEVTYPNDPDFRGYWAVNDFDRDGKMEFATATRNGEVFFVEHVAGDTGYAITFSDTTRYINAFFHTEGNDLDGDGRPECFIGSDDSGGLNNIAVYETTGDNRFEVSAWIEIYPVGSFIWQWIWTGDVTGDGRDEIVLATGNTLVILKAFADDEYRVIWYHRYGSEISHRLLDIDSDGTMEILLSAYNGVSGITRIMAWSRQASVGTNTQNLPPFNFTISPNPAASKIIVTVKSESAPSGRIELYSPTGMLISMHPLIAGSGKESMIRIAVDDFQGGVYFVRVLAGNFVQTKKCIVFH